VEQALKFTPIQSDVDYTQPKPGDIADCKISAQKIDGHVGWVVEDAQGGILRRFIDTNGDNQVDMWCYFKDGLEVYRDIDSDFDRKADQYRWFHTGGSRWGIDKDEDGTIDSWAMISAEEVTAEVIAAMAKQEPDRFDRLLLTAAELRSLGLGGAKTKELAEKIAAASSRFRDVSRQQKVVRAETKWTHFSSNPPGIVPAGTNDSTKDLQVYENAIAITQTGGEHGQVQIGTLVRVGDVWRVIDAPQPVTDGQQDLASSGFFFRAPQNNRSQVAAASAPSAKMQEILSELEKLDAAAGRATTAEQQAQFNAKRADLLERMAGEAGKPEERGGWLRQLADMISAAVQSGTYPDGAKRLESLLERLQRTQGDRQLAAYVRFRQISAEYGLSMQARGADFAKIQTEWLKRLEQYVGEYPQSPDAAEAMLQLAIAQEFAGQEEEAKKWYARIVQGFPDTPTAKKAAGARSRLESVGKVLEFQGKSPSGEVVELAKYRGQIVLIQYWATWCEPCKADMAMLKELVDKYGRAGFAVLGINLDNDPQVMASYLKESPLPWAQIFEEGGLDSRPAVELGILTLPTMILVDQNGKVVNRNISTTELANELKKLAR
jgi:thiol-disulfide isomerase/thioredoxin